MWFQAQQMVWWKAYIPGGGKTTKARTNAVLQGNDRFAAESRLTAKLRERQNYILAAEFQEGGNHRLQGNP